MPGWKYAFSLSRDAVKAATPPGTVRLIEHGTTQENGRYIDRLAKYPVPTSDPADPLNWAPWRKFACVATVSLYGFVASFVSISLLPALPSWDVSFPDNPLPLASLMQFVAFNVLLLGLSSIFWVPLANIFGRRPVLVTSALMLFISSACGTATSDFHKVLVIRIFQGVGSAVSQTVAVAIVGDMFFVHERGAQMAIYAASLASGSAAGGISGVYIASRLGWYGIFNIDAVLSGLAFLCTIFLAPETIYERDAPYLPIQRTLPRASRYFPRTPAPYLSLASLPSTMQMTLPSRFLASVTLEPQDPGLTWYQTSSSGDLSSSATTPARRSKMTRSSRVTALTHLRYPPYTYWRSLVFGMYRGNVSYQFAKPWATLRLPVTWIAMTQYGALVGSWAAIAILGPQVLFKPPYSWGDGSGLIFIGALIGNVCGAIYTVMTADHRLKALAKKHDHGYGEPESRIPIMLPSLALATAGLLVFGFCAQLPGRYRWVGLEFASGMVAFGLTQVMAVWFSYVVDSYSQLATDCLAMVSIPRGIVPFALLFIVAPWVAIDGFLIPFGVFTVVMAVASLLVVPLLWTGKRMRIAAARYIVGSQ